MLKIQGAEHGFITLTATNVGKTMTVPGGKGRIIGNARELASWLDLDFEACLK